MSRINLFENYEISRPNRQLDFIIIDNEKIPLSKKAKEQLKRLLSSSSNSKIIVTVANFDNGKRIVRVTSKNFQYVLHSELEDVIRMALSTVFSKTQFEIRRVKFSKGLWIEVLKNGQRFLGFYNYNDARHSIRIWLYLAPFPIRLARIIHKAKNRNVQKEKLVQVLKNILENLDVIKERIDSLKELELTRNDFVQELIEKGFPEYIINTARKRNFNTAWSWIWWLAAQVFKRRKKSLLDLYEKIVQKYVTLSDFLIL